MHVRPGENLVWLKFEWAKIPDFCLWSNENLTSNKDKNQRFLLTQTLVLKMIWKTKNWGPDTLYKSGVWTRHRHQSLSFGLLEKLQNNILLKPFYLPGNDWILGWAKFLPGLMLRDWKHCLSPKYTGLPTWMKTEKKCWLMRKEK